MVQHAVLLQELNEGHTGSTRPFSHVCLLGFVGNQSHQALPANSQLGQRPLTYTTHTSMYVFWRTVALMVVRLPRLHIYKLLPV